MAEPLLVPSPSRGPQGLHRHEVLQEERRPVNEEVQVEVAERGGQPANLDLEILEVSKIPDSWVTANSGYRLPFDKI